MKDRYRNYVELSQSETIGVDYSIYAKWRTDQVLVMAIHGGGIETGTSEIASAIADPAWSVYIFSGDKRLDNQRLHITSTRFDEPIALEMAQRALRIVTIHGVKGNQPIIYLGGRDQLLMRMVKEELHSASFRVMKAPPHLSGNDPRNIVNQGRSGCGLQMELSSALRDSFFHGSGRKGRTRSTPQFTRFVSAVKRGIHRHIDVSK